MTHPALDIAEQCKYPNGFWPWFYANQQVWNAFRIRAIRMALMGRKTYSARTIIENVRWDTEIKDSTVHFKINDHFTPGLARYWMHVYGERWSGFFKLRDSLGRDL